MAKTINEEFDEAEGFDSYDEPEQDVAPTEQETVASDEEIAAEDEQIDVGQAESPTVDVEPVSETPEPTVDNPELTEATAPASQVTESSLPPDEAVDRSPDVTQPPEPGEASVDVADAPTVEEDPVEMPEVYDEQQQQPETTAAPEVSEYEIDIQEQPTLSASVDEPLTMPSVIEDEAPSATSQEVMDEPVGFQGEVNLPDVPEAEFSPMPQHEDAALRHDQRTFSQVQSQQKSTEDLARSLAENIDPFFDQMRQANEDTLHDYMQRQLIETTIIGRIR